MIFIPKFLDKKQKYNNFINNEFFFFFFFFFFHFTSVKVDLLLLNINDGMVF